MKAGCRSLSWFLLAALAVQALSGCRKNELLESEIRARDFKLREALDEMKKLECHNEALQRENTQLRHQKIPSTHLLKKADPPGMPGVEESSQTFGLKRIVFGRLTGGQDTDGIPGDEALLVVLEPRDALDHALKTPGQLFLSVLEITPQGNKIPLSTWEFGPEKLRLTWRQGLLSTGYTLTLPWKSWPTSDNLRLVARLILADGRVFETDKDIRVRLPQGLAPTFKYQEENVAPLPMIPEQGGEAGPDRSQPPHQSDRFPSGQTTNHSSWQAVFSVTSKSQNPQENRPQEQSSPLHDAVKLVRPTPLE